MSRPSNSAMDMNIFTELEDCTVDNKVTSTETQRGTKRAASEQLEGQTKKTMADQHSREEKNPNQISKSFNQVKFVSAADMVGIARTTVQIIPELSDEELLQMTIEFEKKYPQ